MSVVDAAIHELGRLGVPEEAIEQPPSMGACTLVIYGVRVGVSIAKRPEGDTPPELVLDHPGFANGITYQDYQLALTEKVLWNKTSWLVERAQQHWVENHSYAAVWEGTYPDPCSCGICHIFSREDMATYPGSAFEKQIPERWPGLGLDGTTGSVPADELYGDDDDAYDCERCKDSGLDPDACIVTPDETGERPWARATPSPCGACQEDEL